MLIFYTEATNTISRLRANMSRETWEVLWGLRETEKERLL